MPVESSDVPAVGNVKRRAVLLCCLGYSVDRKPRGQSFRVAVLALWIVADVPDGLNAECWDNLRTGVPLRSVRSALAFEALHTGTGLRGAPP